MENLEFTREGRSHMLAVAILASTTGNETIRVVLFIMVLIAVALLLAGSVIALMTLYKQLKGPARDETRR
ncbi:MAG: hypothetical protein JO215_10000 [Ktedonobacteraceae bacterium]|nr:hypothetical protein [Ktedonobacteraceae bacterium]